MPVTTTPISITGGTYWTLTGIQEQIGENNAAQASDLENGATLDMDRVIADGTVADAYTDRRARMGNKKYVTPIPESSADILLIREATNLYAAYLLAVHKVWAVPVTPGDEDNALAGLYGRAMRRYEQLFGPERDGVDGEVATDGTPQPGTLTSIGLNFGDTCCRDEFSSNC